jgi:hemolysin D
LPSNALLKATSMPRETILQLDDCSELRQTLAARPPRIVHGTALLMACLLVAVLVWSALVKANLVVRASGRIRPAEIPTRIFISGSADPESRIVEAPFEVGDEVKRGDILLRLDTVRVDNRIAKLERTAAAAEEELEKLRGLEALMQQQLEAAREKALSELAQAETALRTSADRRASEVRSAQSVLAATEDRWRRIQQLFKKNASSQEAKVKAQSTLDEAREKLVQLELPLEDGPVLVARRAVELVNREFAVRTMELEARVAAKRGEAEAARKELTNLYVQREESVIKAPVDGVVISGRVQVGDVPQSGKSVLEIAQQRRYRFEALVPSVDMGELRVGMPVRIKFDAYDYQRYGVLQGEVAYLSPDSNTSASVALTTGDNSAKPNGAPAMFLVRVDLHDDHVGRGDLHGPVKLGLGATAEIVSEQRSLLAVAFKRLRHSISLE